jgi:hypothetical protein
MLPVSLYCLRPVPCVPNVASFSVFSSSCVLCTQMLPVSLYCLRPVSFWYTRHRTKTIQRHWQLRAPKTKKTKTKTQHNMCWTPLGANKHIIAQHKKTKRRHLHHLRHVMLNIPIRIIFNLSMLITFCLFSEYGEQGQELGIKCYLLNIHHSSQRWNYS